MKVKKTVLALLLTFTLVCGMIPNTAFADGITVILDGNPLSFEVPPQNENGRIMVPLRAIFEAMGATIEWDGATQTVTAVRGDTVVILRVGDTSPTVNGQVVTIDQPGLLVDGRTLAPLRFVAEAFGGAVEWDATTQTASISSNGSAAPVTSTPMPALQGGEVEIDLSGQDITNEQLAQMVASGEIPANVTILELSYNQITDIAPLSGLTNLTSLALGFNQISDISPLIGLTNLTELWLFGNQISDISPLNGLTNLTHLYLEHNPISDISPLRGLTNLTELILWDNQISDISPLSGLTSLTSLYLTYNPISDISPLSGLTNLTRLWLVNNQISDISPLSGLTNLTALRLGNNQISDISPLSGLTNLTELALDHNQISDISPLSRLTNLTWLVLTNNPITDWSPVDHVEYVEGRP